MKTQNEALLDYLRSSRTITQAEALANLGIARLAARIRDLKDSGANIYAERVVVPCRGGRTATVAKYHLVSATEVSV